MGRGGRANSNDHKSAWSSFLFFASWSKGLERIQLLKILQEEDKISDINEVFLLDGVLSLHVSCNAKGPAGTTLTLHNIRKLKYIFIHMYGKYKIIFFAYKLHR
jgi:hypothetical protein